jgi:hypothetical protein
VDGVKITASIAFLICLGVHPLAAGHKVSPDILQNGRRAIKAK